jgi:TetR/AcrR family transcriptional repressor of nem operon
MKTMMLARHDSKVKLMDAALHVIRAKGYTATTVDDICKEAGLTKGSFFHHFKSKEELALASADHFGQMAEELFSAAPYRNLGDPLERLFGYIDFRRSILKGELPDYTCLLGTMVQETYETHPAIRDACERNISGHASAVAKDIALAKERYAPEARWDPEELGLYTQAVLQGAFILAKAKNGPEIAEKCVDHLRQYFEFLFNRGQQQESTP